MFMLAWRINKTLTLHISQQNIHFSMLAILSLQCQLQNEYPLICDIICANSQKKWKVLQTFPNFSELFLYAFTLRIYSHFYIADFCIFSRPVTVHDFLIKSWTHVILDITSLSPAFHHLFCELSKVCRIVSSPHFCD